MPPLSHLLMLIVAFFGADLSGAKVDINTGWADLDEDIIADFCTAFDLETLDFHNDYSEAWYEWENCMLAYDDHSLANLDSDHRIGRVEAEELVAEIWEAYTPWMREALSETLRFPTSDNDGGVWIVLADDWAPPLPRVNTGTHKVKEHCGEDDALTACAVPPSLDWELGELLGETMIWRSNGTADQWAVFRGDVVHHTSGRVVTPKRNLYDVLHETAHLINDYQYVTWHGWKPSHPRHHEHQRTGGHDIDFKCLLLDLYTNYGDHFVETDDWWQVSYDELHRICKIIVPNYARPATPTDN